MTIPHKITTAILAFTLSVSVASAAWNTTKSSGDPLVASDWNDMVNQVSSWVRTNTTSSSDIYLGTTGGVGIGDPTPDNGLKLDVEGKIGATDYCDANGLNCTAAADLASGAVAGTSTTMTSGWPDAIRCVSGSDSRYLFHTFSESAGASHQYRLIHDSAASYINFDAAGAFSSSAGMAGWDCVANTWSIADIGTNSRNYRFVGGQSVVNDADNDTKIQVEQSADDDTIRLITLGIAALTLDNAQNATFGGTVDATSYTGDGSALTGVVTSESDPQVGVLTAGKWCRESGGVVTCDQNTPAATDTNAATICAAGEFLNGDGTCDPVVVDTNTQLSEATVDSYANNNGYSIGAHTTDTNAGTICANGTFLNGDTTCDAGYLDADGVDDDTPDSNAEVPDAITVAGGIFGSNTISAGSAWAVTDSLNIDSNTFAVDGTNNRIGVGTATPGGKMVVIGAGTTSGTYGFNVTNSIGTSNFFVRDDGNIGIGNTAPGEKLEVSGNIKATSFIYTSDERLKKNIATIQDPLEKIQALRGVDFDWKKDDQKDIGFIAQEVEEVLPELVHTSESDGMKSVQYGNIVAVMVEALKELANKIEILFTLYLDQQAQIDALEQRLEALEQ